jgi:hypothetical protein
MWSKNITGLDTHGIFRSLNGAADENIFIGKASKAGFFCFFKVWRDMPYDAVLDYAGTLFRVEVKGSATGSFNLTRGGRAGTQINRDAENRTRLIERRDCDFVVGVDNDNGDCYIIPVDFIEILGRDNLSKYALEAFKEKWNLFMGGRISLDLGLIRDGLMRLGDEQIREIAESLEVTVPTGPLVPIGTRNLEIVSEKQKMIVLIWQTLANEI